MTDKTERKINKTTLGRRIMLLVMAFLTAVAIAVTCVVYFDVESPVVNSVEDVDTSDSVTTSASNSQNLTVSGTLIQNGQYKDYTSGNSWAVTIPRGTYKLEVWGGRGGQQGGTPGYGGYTYGTYTTTAQTVLYFYLGGMGTNGNSTSGSKAGGYNGGGNGYRYGSGGGGATHVSTRDGLLNSLSSYKASNLLLVAGGGGGSQNRPGGNGGGGNNNGVKCSSTSYGTGGCGGGTGGAHADCNSSHTSGSQSGSFGQGGPGSAGGDGNGGGGGGGGLYGGCGVTSDGSVVDDKGGGGGSGYINTSYITGGGGSTGNWSGAGKARLTAISVNTPPTVTNPTISGTFYRGTQSGSGITVSSTQLGSDPDYQNTTSGAANKVYFTAGTASNYDTVAAANAGVFVNSACTTLATNYITWTWSGNQTLYITSIKRYPRAGTDGQENGKLVLYTRIRDNFGSTTTRGVSVACFKINVADREIQFKSTAVTSYGNYRVGNSTSTNASLDYISNTTQIYNPNGTGKNTVFLPKPISPTDKTAYTINATNIYSDADTAYDKVGIKSVTIPSNVSSYFTITYNSDNTYASGIYPSITIKATGVRPPSATWVALTINAQSSETTPKLAVGNGNTAVQLVFKISNTRPYFASASQNTANQREPLIQLNPGGTATLSLSEFLYDIDDGSNITSTFATTASDLKVPTNEYVSVDMTGLPITLKNSYVYGGQTIVSNYATYTNAANNQYIDTNTTTGSCKTGEGKNCPTGFNKDLVAMTGSAAAASASVLYSYENGNKTIRFTARAATQYQYSDTDVHARLGDFYVLVRVVDPSDSSDNGIWYPIALKVNSTAPTEPTPLGSVTLGFTPVENFNGNVAHYNAVPQYITPISYIDDNGNVQGVGYYSNDASTNQAIPFAIDADGFRYSSGALNDVVVLDGGSDGTTAAINNTATTTGTFFTVTPVRLTAPLAVFSRIDRSVYTSLGIQQNQDNQTATFWGLQLTPNRSTGNDFFRLQVKVKDSHSVTATVNVCVRVLNRDIEKRTDPNDTGDARINALESRVGVTPRGSYGRNDNIGMMAVNYTIENMDVLQITPYDLAYDYDMDPTLTALNPTNNSGTAVEYNTNPYDSDFATAAEYITRTYSVAKSTSASDRPAVAPATAQLLSFVNPEGISATAAQYSSYIGVEVRGAVYNNSIYDDIPCVTITGRSRTTSAVVQLRFEITDGFSSIDCVITVTVLNSAPLLNTIENHPKEETEGENPTRIRMPYYLCAGVSAQGYNNSVQFTAREIAYDKDGDTPTFVAGSAKIVAKIGDSYYQYLDASFGGLESAEGATYALADYAYATITKDNSGNDIVQVTALSATEFFPVQIYLQFTVQDGFRAQMGTSELHLLIEVKNSKPFMNIEGLNVIKEDAENPDNSDFAWKITYEDESELLATRYIANCEELYDSLVGDDGKTVVASNKIWLFDDADKVQRTLLNPISWSNNASALTAQVRFENEERVLITEQHFKANENAAVIYTPMYTGNGFINISVVFYEKTQDNAGKTVFKSIAGENNNAITTSKYWALKIVDPTGSSGVDVQIAFAIRDDHDGKYLHDSAWKTNVSSTANQSNTKIYNFYYGYSSPGIVSMHETYRTDGNAEAQSVVGKGPDNVTDMYLVDQRQMSTSYFKNTADQTRWATLSAEEKQTMLQTVEFTENFRYLYYVKTYSDGSVSHPSYKVFGDTVYAPIPVTSSTVGGKTYIPMSYIAMPKAHGEVTEPNNTSVANVSPHVVFANVTANSTTDARNKLLDSEYTSYGADSTKLAAVFANMSLSDGVTTWTGSNINSNPYITIEYVTTTDANVKFDKKYLNQPFKLNLSSGAIAKAPMSNTDFREDKYGFAFSKKSVAGQDSVRSPGTLKLTIAVKTVGISSGETTESNIENVSVDINLVNSKPTAKYHDETSNGSLTGISVEMTTDDTEGRTIRFIRDDTLGNHSNDKYNIYYKDDDKAVTSSYAGDTMKFYMPSALGMLTEKEADYIVNWGMSCSGTTSSALLSYYNVNSINDILTVDPSADATGKVNRYTYNPNPEYQRFFSVSPSSGSTSSLQFIPNAKTQPQYPENETEEAKAAYRARYNLSVDTSGGVYYPFRVLFYDECNGSSFMEGYWTLVIFKVYITNNKITHNSNIIGPTDRYKSTSSATARYSDKPLYKFDLSTDTAFVVDVTSLLVDNDIALDPATGTFITDATSFQGDDKYIKDYLVMPTASDGVNLTRLVDASAPMPVTVVRGGDSGTSAYSLPKTSLVFSTQTAFKNRVDIAYTFSDSTGDSESSVTIVFSVGYNNAAPKANTDTFGGSDAIDIYLKHGDYFVAYAGDSAEFARDVAGGFESAKTGPNKLGGVKFPLDADGRNTGNTIKTAEDMYLTFKRFVGSYPSDRGATGDMGSIILASDDAASTLRIQTYSIGQDQSRFVEVREFGDRYVMESDLDSTLPIALRVRALGAITTELRITLVDGSGATMSVVLRLHVQSTPPTVNPSVTRVGSVGNSSITLVKSTDSSTPGVFTTSIPYGTKARFAIAGFMTDVDTDDASNLRVYMGMDGNEFTIDNPQALATVAVQSVTENFQNYIDITAVDYITRQGETTDIKFRVVDPNGAISDYITIKVTITPAEVTAVAGPTKSIDLMSYADFVNVEGNSSANIIVDLVTAGTSGLFTDLDVSAPSAQYNVAVYALIKKVGDAFVAARVDELSTSEMIIARVVSGNLDYVDTRSELYRYVANFFAVTISLDGKKLEFTPNSATFNTSASNITSIPLYISVSKYYSVGQDTTMPEVYTSANVSVANSKLIAVDNSPFNVGYPYVNEMPREADFLEFTGKAGDSLTWKLYDNDNPNDYEYGLFYDWDMRRASGGKETIEYVGYKVVMSVNDMATGKGDVLSVSQSGSGAGQTVTIKINRKVYPTGAPSVAIDVYIYATDSIGKAHRATPNDTEYVASTVIKVNVINDEPEIATTGLVRVCPICGSTTGVHQNVGSANTATCSDCRNSFKSLDPDLLGYTITLSEVDGYVLNASLENGSALSLNIPDIINDADIAMDGYRFVRLGSSDDILDSEGNIIDTIMSSDGQRRLFDVSTYSPTNDYGTTSLSRITFTCRSNSRGQIGTVRMQFTDSVDGSTTHVLTVRLTVDNIAPKSNGASTSITMMGVGGNVADGEVESRGKTFSILDYVTDDNGDAFDATTNPDRFTYVFIDTITVYMTDDLDNRPTLYGQGVYERDPESGAILTDDLGQNVYAHDTLCTVEWADEKHQKFKITPFKQVYGIQKFTLAVSDSGYMDGIEHDIYDGKTTLITFTVTVANPLEDVAETLDPIDMVYGVTGTVTAENLLGSENSYGYTISSIVEEGGRGYLKIYEPDAEHPDWRIYSQYEAVTVNLTVTFTAGGNTVTRTLPFRVTENHKPEYKNGRTSYEFLTKDLLGNEKNQMRIYPEDWFEDIDEGDEMMFVAPISSSQTVKVEVLRALDENGRAFILLTFHRRGESQITLHVGDLSGRNYEYTVTVNCTDAPELSMWENFVAYYEENTMWFWIFVAGGLLLIGLIILIIIIVVKKRKMRREIEALLESETELEEQMMRLTAGPALGMGGGFNNSFGMLGPASAAPNPGLMLGGGSDAPAANTLALGAGTGAPSEGIAQTPPSSSQPGTVNTIPDEATAQPPVQPAPQQPPVQPTPQQPPVQQPGMQQPGMQQPGMQRPAQPGVPPQYGQRPAQPGMPPQYGQRPAQPGMPPQYGQPQYGQPQQPGVPPQYGQRPAQPGVPPQYGQRPAQPGVPPQYGQPQYGQPQQPPYGQPPQGPTGGDGFDPNNF